jgi:hypothetical protein
MQRTTDGGIVRLKLSVLLGAAIAFLLLSLAAIFQEPPRFVSDEVAFFLFIASIVSLVAVILLIRDHNKTEASGHSRAPLGAGSKTAFLKTFYFLGALVRRIVSRRRDKPPAANRSGNLIERNQDLIANRLFLIAPDSDANFVENQVRYCIAEIAEREGKRHLSPKHEWLSQWEQRPNIPVEYRQLKHHLMALFQARHTEALKQKQQQEVAERERLEDLKPLKREGLVARNQDLIDTFLDVTERKVSILDDYGDEQWDVLPDEVKRCLKKIVQREGLIDKWNEAEHVARTVRRGLQRRPYGKEEQIRILLNHLPEEYREMDQTLTELFRERHEYLKTQFGESPILDSVSGQEFEAYVAKRLKSDGYEVSGTPKTGDQGADLIAKKDGKKVIIQAKRYQGPVGNKAVQEVIGAVSFYGGDEGWVVTNSTFTASAKALAQKAGIRLIDRWTLQTEFPVEKTPRWH